MTDTYQILLTSVISVLTVLLTLIGIQLFLILNEVRNILKKTNNIVNDASKVTHAVVQPIQEASTFLIGLKNGLGVVNKIKKIFDSNGSKE
jgi:hypothetical protein